MDELSADEAAARFNAHAISLGWPARCYGQLDFAHKELNAVAAIWREKERLGRPSRADFDARTLKPFLANVWTQDRVCETDGTWRYRVRLCGTEITYVIGERTGRFVDEFVRGGTLERWIAYNDTVLGAGKPLRFVMPFQNRTVRYLQAETFMAPLANGDDPPATLLCVTYFGPKRNVAAAAE